MKSSDFAEPGNELAPYVNSHIVSQTLTEIFFNKNEIYYVLTGSSQVAEFLGKLAGKMFVVGGSPEYFVIPPWKLLHMLVIPGRCWYLLAPTSVPKDGWAHIVGPSISHLAHPPKSRDNSSP